MLLKIRVRVRLSRKVLLISQHICIHGTKSPVLAQNLVQKDHCATKGNRAAGRSTFFTAEPIYLLIRTVPRCRSQHVKVWCAAVETGALPKAVETGARVLDSRAPMRWSTCWEFYMYKSTHRHPSENDFQITAVLLHLKLFFTSTALLSCYVFVLVSGCPLGRPTIFPVHVSLRLQSLLRASSQGALLLVQSAAIVSRDVHAHRMSSHPSRGPEPEFCSEECIHHDTASVTRLPPFLPSQH